MAGRPICHSDALSARVSGGPHLSKKEDLFHLANYAKRNCALTGNAAAARVGAGLGCERSSDQVGACREVPGARTPEFRDAASRVEGTELLPPTTACSLGGTLQ